MRTCKKKRKGEKENNNGLDRLRREYRDFFIPSQNEFDSVSPSFSTFSIVRKEICTRYMHIYT